MSFAHELRDSFNLRGAPSYPEVEEEEELPEDSDFRLTNPYRFQKEGFVAFAIARQKLYRLKYDAAENNAHSHIEPDGRTPGRMQAIVYVSNLSKPEEITETYHFDSNADDNVVGDFGIVVSGKYLYLIVKYSTASDVPNYGGNPVTVWQMNTANHRVREIVSASNNFYGMVVDGEKLYLVMNEGSAGYLFNNVGGWERVETGDIYELDQESLEYTKLLSEGEGEIRMICEVLVASPREIRTVWHGVWYVDEDGYAWNTMVITDRATLQTRREMLWAGLAAWRWLDLPSFLENGTANAQYVNLATDSSDDPERELGALIGLDYTPDGDTWDWDTDNFARNLGFNMDALGVIRVSYLRNIRLDMSPGAEGKFTHLFRTGVDGLIAGDDIPIGYRSPSWKNNYSPVGYEWVGSNIENTDDFDSGVLHTINMDQGTNQGSEPRSKWRWSISVSDDTIADFVSIPQSRYLYFVGLDSGTTDVTISVNDGVQITELVTFRLTWDLPDDLEQSSVLFFQGSAAEHITEVEVVANDIVDLQQVFTAIDDRVYVGSETGFDERDVILRLTEGGDLVLFEEGIELLSTITHNEVEYTLKRIHIKVDGSALNHEERTTETAVLKALIPGEALVSGDVFEADSESLTITIKIDVMELNPTWFPSPGWSPRRTGDREWDKDTALVVGQDHSVEVDLSDSVIAGEDDVTFEIADGFSSTIISATISGDTLTITGLTEGDDEVEVEATDGTVTLTIGTFSVESETYEEPTLVDNWYPPLPWDPQSTGSRQWSRDAYTGSDNVIVDLSGSVNAGNGGPIRFYADPSVTSVSVSSDNLFMSSQTETEKSVTIKATDDIMDTPLTIGTFTVDFEDEYVKPTLDPTWTPGAGWNREGSTRNWSRDSSTDADGNIINLFNVNFNGSVVSEDDAVIEFRPTPVGTDTGVSFSDATLVLTITRIGEGEITVTVTATDEQTQPDNPTRLNVAVLTVNFQHVPFTLNPNYDPGVDWRHLGGIRWEFIHDWLISETGNDNKIFVDVASTVVAGNRPVMFTDPEDLDANVESDTQGTVVSMWGISEGRGRVKVYAFDQGSSHTSGTTEEVAIFEVNYIAPEPDLELALDPDWTPGEGWTNVGGIEWEKTIDTGVAETVNLDGSVIKVDEDGMEVDDPDAAITFALNPPTPNFISTDTAGNTPTHSLSDETLTMSSQDTGTLHAHVEASEGDDDIPVANLNLTFEDPRVFELVDGWDPGPDWTDDGDRRWTASTTWGGGGYEREINILNSVNSNVDFTYEFSPTVNPQTQATRHGNVYAIYGLERKSGEVSIVMTAENDFDEVLTLGTFVITYGAAYEAPTVNLSWSPGSEWDLSTDGIGNRTWSRDMFIGNQHSVTVDLSGAVDRGTHPIEYYFSSSPTNATKARMRLNNNVLTITGLTTASDIGINLGCYERLPGGAGIGRSVGIGSLNVDITVAFNRLAFDTTWNPPAPWERVADKIWRRTATISEGRFPLDLSGSTTGGLGDVDYRARSVVLYALTVTQPNDRNISFISRTSALEGRVVATAVDDSDDPPVSIGTFIVGNYNTPVVEPDEPDEEEEEEVVEEDVVEEEEEEEETEDPAASLYRPFRVNPAWRPRTPSGYENNASWSRSISAGSWETEATTGDFHTISVDLTEAVEPNSGSHGPITFLDPDEGNRTWPAGLADASIIQENGRYILQVTGRQNTNRKVYVAVRFQDATGADSEEDVAVLIFDYEVETPETTTIRFWHPVVFSYVNQLSLTADVTETGEVEINTRSPIYVRITEGRSRAATVTTSGSITSASITSDLTQISEFNYDGTSAVYPVPRLSMHTNTSLLNTNNAVVGTIVVSVPEQRINGTLYAAASATLNVDVYGIRPTAASDIRFFDGDTRQEVQQVYLGQIRQQTLGGHTVTYTLPDGTTETRYIPPDAIAVFVAVHTVPDFFVHISGGATRSYSVISGRYIGLVGLATGSVQGFIVDGVSNVQLYVNPLFYSAVGHDQTGRPLPIGRYTDSWVVSTPAQQIGGTTYRSASRTLTVTFDVIAPA